MTDTELESLVTKLLTHFYEQRLAHLSEITLTTICRKNPSLFRIISTVELTHIIEGVLQTFLSSWDETVFNSLFFEPLVLTVSQTDGERPFSAVTKNHDAILDCCYGRATATLPNKIFRHTAGQKFWEELTGDEQFYMKIIPAMGALPDVHKQRYNAERIRLGVRLGRDFLVNFVTADGHFHWDKLMAFNNGRNPPVRLLSAVAEPGTGKIILEEMPVCIVDNNEGW